MKLYVWLDCGPSDYHGHSGCIVMAPDKRTAIKKAVEVSGLTRELLGEPDYVHRSTDGYYWNVEY
jgi:hypothetical protein